MSVFLNFMYKCSYDNKTEVIYCNLLCVYLSSLLVCIAIAYCIVLCYFLVVLSITHWSLVSKMSMAVILL